MPTRDRVLSVGYVLWAVAAVGLAFLKGGGSADNTTRLLIIAFLLLQLLALPVLRRLLSRLKPRLRFLVSAVPLAAIVEGLYMISRPAFPSLRIGFETDLPTALRNYGLDLALTVPAYVVIFSTIWSFLTRYRYTLWEYIVLMALGQALGDGFVYFLSAPAMLLFLPYPMLNYHAVNVIPYLSVRDELPPTARQSWRRFLAVPLVVAVYLVCGATISMVGKLTGLNE